MYLFYKFILVLTISSVPFFSALAEENSMGLLAEELNSFAPPETGQWDKMIGNWNLVFFELNPEGEVTRELKGEWNWSYILNGHAIQLPLFGQRHLKFDGCKQSRSKVPNHFTIVRRNNPEFLVLIIAYFCNL